MQVTQAMTEQGRRLFETLSKLRATNVKRMMGENLTPGEFSVLNDLVRLESEGHQTTVSEYADRVMSRLPATSRFFKQMEDKNLIRRVTSEVDRRYTYILVTPEGRQAYEEALAGIEGIYDYVVEGMEEAELSAFFTAFDKLHARLGEAIAQQRAAEENPGTNQKE